MRTLRTYLIAICTAVFLIEAVAYDMFPTQWNLVLMILAILCVVGMALIAHVQRNEVNR